MTTLSSLAALALGLAAASPALAQTSVGDDETIVYAPADAGATASWQLQRIAKLDDAGPMLNAVIAINPDAPAEALAAEQAGLPLMGRTVLVKDNVETRELPTTAGSLALAGNMTRRDAPLIANLRDAGGVVLGKTNLSEWANIRDFRSTSGWSAVGGLTRNPHAIDRNTCGSSSGSGAAVAAGFAWAAIGTETNGSITCPASKCSWVGLAPSASVHAESAVTVRVLAAARRARSRLSRAHAAAKYMFDNQRCDQRGYVCFLAAFYCLSLRHLFAGLRTLNHHAQGGAVGADLGIRHDRLEQPGQHGAGCYTAQHGKHHSADARRVERHLHLPASVRWKRRRDPPIRPRRVRTVSGILPHFGLQGIESHPARTTVDVPREPESDATADSDLPRWSPVRPCRGVSARVSRPAESPSRVSRFRNAIVARPGD